MQSSLTSAFIASSFASSALSFNALSMKPAIVLISVSFMPFVGAAGHQRIAPVNELLREHLCVREYLLLVLGEGLIERLFEGHGLRGDYMHERAALYAGEYLLVNGLRELLAAHYHAAPRPSARLVRGSGDEVGARHRARVQAGGDKARYMGDIDHYLRAYLVGHFPEGLEVDYPQ